MHSVSIIWYFSNLTTVKETFSMLSLSFFPTQKGITTCTAYLLQHLLSQPQAIPTLLRKAPEQNCCMPGSGGVHVSWNRNGWRWVTVQYDSLCNKPGRVTVLPILAYSSISVQNSVPHLKHLINQICEKRGTKMCPLHWVHWPFFPGV